MKLAWKFLIVVCMASCPVAAFVLAAKRAEIRYSPDGPDRYGADTEFVSGYEEACDGRSVQPLRWAFSPEYRAGRRAASTRPNMVD